VISDIVEVWLIRTDVPDSVLAELEALLDNDERQRAANFLFPARRRQFIASHGAVRVILGRHLGVPAGTLRWRRGPHGKPELAGPGLDAGLAAPELGGPELGGPRLGGPRLGGPGPQVSFSKSGNLAALAIGGDRRVGVDVQRLLADLDVTRMAQRFYPPQEALFVRSARGTAEQVDRFTRLWARKEACVKVSGGRLFPGLQLTVLRPGVIGPDMAGTPAAPYLVRDLRVPRGFRAAVAAEGMRPFSITRRWMHLPETTPTPIPASEIAAQ
jgi:4'-phosphopantetheinyl transferase